MSRRFRAGAIAVAASIVGMVHAPSPADAGLVFDIRATKKNGIVIAAGNQKQQFVVPGDVLHVTVNAVITGTDGDLTNDGFQSADGSFLSTGGIKGDCHGVIVTDTDTGEAIGQFFTRSPFNTIEAVTPPKNTDLDGDGDLDVGISANPLNGAIQSNPAPPPTTFANYSFRSATMQFTTSNPTSGSLKILGELNFTVTSGNLASDSANLTYIVAAPFGTGLMPFWTQDGVKKLAPDGGITTSSLALLMPEPAGAAVVVMSCLTMIQRRRGSEKTARQSAPASA